MAAFRAITAEEEAASALLLSLQQKGYPGADRLNHRDHVQKLALTPFFHAVSKVLAAVDFANPIIRLEENATPPKISIHFDMSNVGIKTPEKLFGSPDQPLNFSVGSGADGHTAHRFEEELQEIARDRGLDQIVTLIKEEANTRNRLLYAAEGGIPSIQFKDGFLTERLRRVTVLVVIAIAIQQTSMHQLFASQCLRSFLLALKKINSAEFCFESPSRSNGPAVEIAKAPDCQPVAWIKLPR